MQGAWVRSLVGELDPTRCNQDPVLGQKPPQSHLNTGLGTLRVWEPADEQWGEEGLARPYPAARIGNGSCVPGVGCGAPGSAPLRGAGAGNGRVRGCSPPGWGCGGPPQSLAL